MRQKLFTTCLSLVTSILFCSAALASAPPLVSVDWLKANRDKPTIVLIDASPTFSYLDGHIPGAISASFSEDQAVSLGTPVSYGGGVDFFTDLDSPVPFQDLPQAEMQKLFRSWGIDQDSHVVLYDAGAHMHAVRLFFSLKYWGIDNVSVLDGGISTWKEAGLPVTTEIATPQKAGNITLGGKPADILATTEDVLNASADTGRYTIVNALGALANNHTGKDPFYAGRGHIPHATYIPWPLMYNADKTFKSREDMRALLEHFNITPDKMTYTHCGGGISGSVAFFSIKYVAGYPEVKHYRNSLIEWERDIRGLPMWTYDEPYRLRDNAWVNLWAGRRNRTLGTVHTDLIDIRTPGEYAAGHPPFAVNIPFANFAANIKTPDNLAKLLGPAGVNKRHEAVLFGKGVSKDSILAMWMLEYMGQGNVSIAVSDMAGWQESGGKAEKTPTVVREREVRFDLALQPTNYAVGVDKAMIADGPVKSSFPVIYVASGSKATASAPDADRMIHLPASAVLDANGLKSSAELYDHFEVNNKLPRAAQIVCVADDPADAAVNWFALKMIGFPQVKVYLK